MDYYGDAKVLHIRLNSDSKVHGASMGPIWGRQDPGGPHVGPINFAIGDINTLKLSVVSTKIFFISTHPQFLMNLENLVE